jgi:hypothetical protein
MDFMNPMGNFCQQTYAAAHGYILGGEHPNRCIEVSQIALGLRDLCVIRPRSGRGFRLFRHAAP